MKANVFVWGFIVAICVVVGCFLLFPNASGDCRVVHRRACVAELRGAKTGADTLRIVLKDAYCGARMGKDL